MNAEELELRASPSAIGLNFGGLGAIYGARDRALDFDRNGRINAKDLRLMRAEITKRVQAYLPTHEVRDGGSGHQVLFEGTDPLGEGALGRPGHVFVEAAWDVFRGYRPSPQRLAQWLAQVAVHEIGHGLFGLGHTSGTIMDPKAQLWVVDWSWADEQVIAGWS